MYKKSRKTPVRRRKIVKKIVKKQKEGFIAHALRVGYSGLKQEFRQKKAKKLHAKKIRKLKRLHAFSQLKTNIKTFFHR